SWKKYTSEQITKITKDHIFKKPEPTLSRHTVPPKSWTMPTPHIQNQNQSNTKCQENLENLMETPTQDTIDLTQTNIHSISK
ncbi:2318_t:CDS:2, partial [Gigaspora rosea]